MGKTTQTPPPKKRISLEIREMGIDDLPTVFHLGEKVFTAREAPNLYRSWDEYEVVELFLGDSEFCLVAESGERILGFALGTTIDKARSPWKYGHLVWLGVEPEFQGTRVGERLFQAITETMIDNGVRILMVDTQMDNLPALGFFRKLGFANPEEQVYLYLNLDKHKRRAGKKRKPTAAKPQRT
jgi:ribosomal protein S18 acetylase RimI-like enzyme